MSWIRHLFLVGCDFLVYVHIILEIIVEMKIWFLYVSFLGTRKETMLGYFRISQETKRNVFISFPGTRKRHGTVRKLRNEKVVSTISASGLYLQGR